MNESGRYCANCRRIYPVGELIAYREPWATWSSAKFVCRPSLDRGPDKGLCFRLCVRGAEVHTIALAETVT